MPDPLTAFLDKLTARVNRDGFSPVHSHDQLGHITGPFMPITYSVGFRALGHPDIFIPGVPVGPAIGFIHQIHAAIVGGATYAPGELYDSLAVGYLAQFKPILPLWADEFMPFCASVYQRQNGERTFTALQLIYPDTQGRWPWDPECEATSRTLQPRLDLPQESPRYAGDVYRRPIIGGGLAIA